MIGNRIVVLGIGNPLCRDDGLGIRVVELMQSTGNYTGIDIIDGGTSPDLFSLLDEVTEKLIIVDALRAGGTPGQLYRLELSKNNLSEDSPPSLHGLGVLDSLQLMIRLGIDPPEVTIIGVEPFDTSRGLSLTAQMEVLVPAVIAEVGKEIGLLY